MYVLFVRLNQKLCTPPPRSEFTYTSAIAQSIFGTILNLTGAFLQNVIFGIISKQCTSTKLLYYCWNVVFVELQEETKFILKLKVIKWGSGFYG